MAELKVQTRCRSILRKGLDTALDVGFPLWGIAAPVVSAFSLLALILLFQRSDTAHATEFAATFAFCLALSLCSLFLKRMLSFDMLTLDKQGIKLPRLMGQSFNFITFISWTELTSISAITSTDKLDRSRITLFKKRGGKVQIPLNQLEPEFAEQFLMASKMWAPALCDKSLDTLQDSLRLGAKENASASYTELWEDELGRRFCPTSYVPLETGRVLRDNTLKVVSQLASGGLSALYLCQLNGKELVVLKESMIPPQSEEKIRDKAREMFEREAKLLMKVDHPSIVHIIDCFAEGDRNYMLLEYVNGVDLRQLVKQNGPQKEIDVLEWAIQIATALKYLHEKEQALIHRDLTPDNLVLRNDGKVIVVDFGAANEFIGNATGTFVGKHSYIAPEQLRGKASTQSDIYAFGCTLAFLLTGQEPEALSPSVPKEILPSISDELSDLIESCTQLEIENRYQSAAQLLPVLKRMAAQSLVT